MTYADIDALLRKAKEQEAPTDAEAISVALSSAWETIREASEHTAAAKSVQDAGMEREFYLMALADLAAARVAAEAQIHALTRYLVNDLNAATVTVARQAGVAQSTASRWAREK